MRLDSIFNPLQILHAVTPKAVALNDELTILQAQLELHIANGPGKITDLPVSSPEFLDKLESAEKETLRAYRMPLTKACVFVANLGTRYEEAAQEAEGIASAADTWNRKLVADLDAVFKKHGCAPHGEHVHSEELGMSRDKAGRASTTAEMARSASRNLPKRAVEFATVINALVANPRRGRPLKIESSNNFSSAHTVGGPSRIGCSANCP